MVVDNDIKKCIIEATTIHSLHGKNRIEQNNRRFKIAIFSLDASAVMKDRERGKDGDGRGKFEIL